MNAGDSLDACFAWAGFSGFRKPRRRHDAKTCIIAEILNVEAGFLPSLKGQASANLTVPSGLATFATGLISVTLHFGRGWLEVSVVGSAGCPLPSCAVP